MPFYCGNVFLVNQDNDKDLDEQHLLIVNAFLILYQPIPEIKITIFYNEIINIISYEDKKATV